MEAMNPLWLFFILSNVSCRFTEDKGDLIESGDLIDAGEDGSRNGEESSVISQFPFLY
jgi:hypothetical protein